jgi:predicted kinase
MPPNILFWPNAMLPNKTGTGIPDLPMKTVVVFFGMTASGKSTLGMEWAASCRAPYHNTDRVRKELAGLEPTDRRPDQVAQGIYSTTFTEKTYQAMLDCARKDFSQGYGMVVLDGSYSTRQARGQVRSLAEELGARCVFVFCTCSDAEVRLRLDQRTRDPEAVSDGRWEIYLYQKATFELPNVSEEGEFILLNTEQRVGDMVVWLAAHHLFHGSRRH